MNIRLSTLVLTLITMLPLKSLASGEAVTISLAVGDGNIYIDQDYSTTGFEESQDAINVEFLLGYRFEPGIAIEFGLIEHVSPGWSNWDSLEESVILISYPFEVGGLAIVPKIGYSRWKLHSDEGSGKGKDLIWSINLEKNFGGSFGMFVSTSKVDYDFGETHSVNLGFKWELDTY